ncbi:MULTISPECIES: FeoA family protein [Desulfosporosinus]|uniref:Ferrous iron transport protein A n=1 Tax=Desulfosporosinus nitroreducens TaxID=2018668 RepID=A0ABT8QM02_9FIRM|nr:MULTISPECIES: FeoA family protein [Desulfosporosinus]MCO1600653.1 ferrous iron transport protein A [Desulfosporosinus nitroreducens]MCO5384825.1 ferrous iron transport protein A [Desulfosporosinus sp.]MDA8220212.1 FeoA family protein [Desulfitobacterium hafniense]MDO0822382.1 ferrous iron transport protein A [Desulfosporosinus nitroreducens]
MKGAERINSLSDLSLGSDCQIVSLELSGLLRRRILDLGIVPGTLIRCIRRGPSGDPTAYMVRGTLIALRSEDAAQIFVRKLSNGEECV